MRLHSMGISVMHENTFGIDRPSGSGDNLLLVFKTEARLWRGEECLDIHPGAFIIYTKGTYQKYCANNKPYMDHYVHFDSIDENYFEENGIWTDRPGYIQNIEEIENLFRLLSREQISKSHYRDENISLFLKLLLRKLGENQCENVLPEIELRHLEELKSLRSELYSTPGKYKKIADMAGAVNLSISHFQALYHKFFSVSCYEDLISARMSCGRDFLRNTNLSVREIAFLCGYESDTCFMRSFKLREGITPSEYRENQGKRSIG